MPFARRRAARRQPKHVKSSNSSSGTSSTAHSRGEVHNRAISVDASVPLLEPEPSTNTEYSRFGSTIALSGTTIPPSAQSTLNAESLSFSRRFTPAFKSFSARPSSPDLEPGLSRSFRSPPQPPLRHARTRIARAPMDTLPEDSVTDGSPQRGPSPTATSTGSHAPVPTPTSWLHIPKTSNVPLIGAFRGSISSLTSAASSSLPTMQHYPSFSNNAQSSSASTRSSQTFYTVVSDGHTPGPNSSSPPSDHGELQPPASAARLKPSGVGERIPQVYSGTTNVLHPSRQASMVYSHKSSMLSVPGGQRRDERERPLSGTAASGSSLSLYSDARSQLGAGEEGRWNGGMDGGSGGVRGKQS